MNSATEMFAVHVIGPDDLHACPDREVAEALALLLNRQFSRYKSAQDVGMRALVVPWPHGYETWKAESEQIQFEVVPKRQLGELTQCDMDEDETW